MKDKSFDLIISRQDLERLAPDVLDSLREFVQYGLCRMNNQHERNASARHFAEMANATLKRFPQLKLNHCGAKTIVTDTQ